MQRRILLRVTAMATAATFCFSAISLTAYAQEIEREYVSYEGQIIAWPEQYGGNNNTDDLHITVQGDVDAGIGTGMNVRYGSTVDVHGDVIGQNDDATAGATVQSPDAATVNIGGDITGFGKGIVAERTGIDDRHEINVGGAIDASEVGIWASDSNIDVGGDVVGDAVGIIAENSDIHVGSDVISDGSETVRLGSGDTSGIGIIANNDSNVTVDGDVHAAGTGIETNFYDTGNYFALHDNGATVNVGGDIFAGDTGIDAANDSVITVDGGITADNIGIYSRDSEITVGGNIVAAEDDGNIGIWDNGSEIRVTGDIKGFDMGIDADGSLIDIGGNVSGNKAGIYAYGSTVTIDEEVSGSAVAVFTQDSTIIINGDVSSDGTEEYEMGDIYLSGTGIATFGSNVHVNGNIDASKNGVEILGLVDEETEVVVEGVITSTNGVLISDFNATTSEEVLEGLPTITVYEINSECPIVVNIEAEDMSKEELTMAVASTINYIINNGENITVDPTSVNDEYLERFGYYTTVMNNGFIITVDEGYELDTDAINQTYITVEPGNNANQWRITLVDPHGGIDLHVLGRNIAPDNNENAPNNNENDPVNNNENAPNNNEGAPNNNENAPNNNEGAPVNNNENAPNNNEGAPNNNENAPNNNEGAPVNNNENAPNNNEGAPNNNENAQNNNEGAPVNNNEDAPNNNGNAPANNDQDNNNNNPENNQNNDVSEQQPQTNAPINSDIYGAPAGSIIVTNGAYNQDSSPSSNGNVPLRVLSLKVAELTPEQYQASIVDSITSMPPGGVLQIEVDTMACLDRTMLNALSSRSDVSMEIVFMSGGKKLRVVIPAGYNIEDLLDEKGYCGFLRLAEILKATEV